MKTSLRSARFLHARKCSPASFRFLKSLVTLFTFFSFIFSTVSYGQLASVNPPTGGFRIDGGLRSDTPTVGQGDWVDGPAGPGGFVLSNAGVPVNSATTGLKTDPYNSGTDGIFTTGSKFNDIIPDLRWFSSTAPNKNDINNAMYHVSKDANNNQWVIIAGDRLSTSGTSYIDFEFLQNTLTKNANGTFTGGGSAGGRTLNDLLISMEYTNGGAVASVLFYQWKAKSGGGYQFVQFTPSDTDAFAMTNAVNETVPFGAFGSTTYVPFAFVEAAINITHALQATGDPCAGLSVKTLWIKTKASASSTAALKDFVDPIPVSFTFGSATIDYADPFCASGTANVTQTGVTGGTYSASPAGLSIDPSTGQINLSTSTPGTYTVTYSFTTNGCNKTATTTVVINPNPVVAANVTQPTCTVATGTITVTSPTGAGVTYSIDGTNYQSSATFSGLNPGTYSVTAKNSSGCISAPVNKTVNAQPPTPDAPAANITQPTCTVATGTITVTSPTGTGITYSIDGTNYQSSATFSGLNPGTYNITVKNSSGCISNPTSKTINQQPPTPSAPAANITQPTCTVATGTITVTSPTGTGITYSIDGTNYQSSVTFSGLNPGTYNITAKNSSGCISSATSKTINAQPPTPDAPVATVTQPTCSVATGTITVTSPTGTGISYSIDGTNYQSSPTFSGLNPGTYSVTAKNSSGCISNATSETVNQQPATPAAPAAHMLMPSCTDKTFSVQIDGPVTGYTYTLTQPGNNNPPATLTANGGPVIFTGLVFGDGYYITSTNTDGCTSDANICGSAPAITKSSSTTTSTATLATQVTKVTAAPNPFNDKIRFTLQSSVSGKGTLDLYNIMGRKVATVFQGYVKQGQSQTIQFNVTDMQRGSLIYVFTVGNQRVSGKLIGLR